jgi:DNA-binding MarR family transcriptional regulator
MARPGAELALLLLGSYRKLVDAAVKELADRGFADVRPVHDFAMRAIAAGADSASELGRRLSVSKQAAAKTIAVLLERGYIAREDDPNDRRRKRIEVTPLGHEVMRTGEEIFDELRRRWQRQLGEGELETLEAHLTAFVGDAPVRSEAPGWVANELDER